MHNNLLAAIMEVIMARHDSNHLWLNKWYSYLESEDG